MDIQVENISKKYGAQWVFKDINFQFKSGGAYAITGSNGAGKSTFLSILVGKTPYTKGKIVYGTSADRISIDDVFNHFSIATTSMSLIEEFTLQELIKFHFRFRKVIPTVEVKDILKMIDLEHEKSKYVSNFSSGMKQRLKIALAIFTKSEVVILDEPGANLDRTAKHWFQNLLKEYRQNRTVIIASNDKEDYGICDEELNISDF